MRELGIGETAARALALEPNGNAARLYLHLLLYGSIEKERACAELRLTREACEVALSRLASLGLYSPPAAREERPPEQRMPEYTPEELASAANGDGGFRGLLSYAEQALGRVMSYNDGAVLLRIYRWMGLPCEVIALLLAHAAALAEEKSPGRKPTMRDVQNLAIKWDKLGICDLEKADEYIRNAARKSKLAHEVCRLLRIPSLSPTAEGYVADWDGWGMGLELIAHAADITMTKFGAVNFKYMNGILRGWHEKGIYSLDDVKKKDFPPHGPRSAPRAPAQKSAPNGSREMESVRRAKERIQSIKEGDDRSGRQ